MASAEPEQMQDGEPAGRSGAIQRFGPLIVIAILAVVFFSSGAHRYLTLESLKENYVALQSFVADHFATALFIFTFSYVLVTATSLPGATLMSLVGGFLFGVAVGVLAVIVGATLGATIIFLIARTALGDSIRNRAGPLIQKLEDGFQENAFSYLLLLRLIPLFPFFIVNIAPAVFGVKTRTFFLATLIGIIPGVFAFVSAGNGLGAVLESGGDLKLAGLLTQPAILTPIIALSVLAIIPIIYQRMMARNTVLRGENSE